MEDLRKYLGVALAFIVGVILFRYLWPVLLVIAVLVIGLIAYLSYKSKKQFNEMNQQFKSLNQDESYSNWYSEPTKDENIEEPVKSSNVIDVDYVERESHDE